MQLNLLVAWCSILAGLLTGTANGLFFHAENWLGGYASWRRRMMRLGHIACFGTGLLNLAFALTVPALGLAQARWSSGLFVMGAVTMPLVCFLSAWRKELRHLFALPVLSLLFAVGTLIFEGFVVGKGS